MQLSLASCLALTTAHSLLSVELAAEPLQSFAQAMHASLLPDNLHHRTVQRHLTCA